MCRDRIAGIELFRPPRGTRDSVVVVIVIIVVLMYLLVTKLGRDYFAPLLQTPTYRHHSIASDLQTPTIDSDL